MPMYSNDKQPKPFKSAEYICRRLRPSVNTLIPDLKRTKQQNVRLTEKANLDHGSEC